MKRAEKDLNMLPLKVSVMLLPAKGCWQPVETARDKERILPQSRQRRHGPADSSISARSC